VRDGGADRLRHGGEGGGLLRAFVGDDDGEPKADDAGWGTTEGGAGGAEGGTVVRVDVGDGVVGLWTDNRCLGARVGLDWAAAQNRGGKASDPSIFFR
jgi:hypothetical protein